MDQSHQSVNKTFKLYYILHWPSSSTEQFNFLTRVIDRILCNSTNHDNILTFAIHRPSKSDVGVYGVASFLEQYE